MTTPIRLLAVALLAVATLRAVAGAQVPGRPPQGNRGPGAPQGNPGPGRPGGMPARTESAVDDFIKRLLSLDADQDGNLQKSEVVDARLHPLFTRVDADRDGVVTQEEMRALYAKESAELAKSRSLRGGPGRPSGPGGRGGPPLRPGESEIPRPPGQSPPSRSGEPR
jgi:hypothetical protein